MTDEAETLLYDQRKKLAHLRELRLGEGDPAEWLHEP